MAPLDNMEKEIFHCDICSGEMQEFHCELVCPNCGYRRDCTDP